MSLCTNTGQARGSRSRDRLPSISHNLHQVISTMSRITRSTSPSEASESDDNDQAKLLQLLNAQCAASLGGVVPVASTSRLEESSDDEQDSSDEGDEDVDNDDEWTGFGNVAPLAGPSANSKQAIVVSFQDSIRSGKRKLDESEVTTFGEKDGFMVRSAWLLNADFGQLANTLWRLSKRQSTKIRRANVESVNEPSRRKGKAKADDDDDER